MAWVWGGEWDLGFFCGFGLRSSGIWMTLEVLYKRALISGLQGLEENH